MKKSTHLITYGLLQLILAVSILGSEDTRFAELDAYWSEVSRAIREGDFEAYQATCHEEGVLVSGSSKKSYPLSKALERWKPGIEDTRRGRNKASVEFRFSQRLGDETTAHETGIFFYKNTNEDGEITEDFIYFEALLVKKEGRWKMLMEYQKSESTEEDWNALE